MYEHQTIEYDNNLPARIRLINSSADRCRGKPHWHEEMQLIYVDDGKLQITVGNQERELGEGDVLVINPGELHSLNGGKARYLSVHFSRVFVKAFFGAVESYDFVLEDGSPEQRETVILMQKLLVTEQNPFDSYSALIKHSLLTKTLRLLLTRCRREKRFSVYGTKRSTESDAILVKSYIEANFRRKIMIAELADLVNYNTCAFTTYFKQLTGKLFTDYVQEVRTRHALDDYLTHDISVGDAALKNGFGHYNHFTNACRKCYGASPTEIKRQKRGKAVSLPLEISA